MNLLGLFLVALLSVPGGGGVQPPVPGGVVRVFEAPPGPYAAGHRGVDLAAVPGEEVRAALPGLVTFAGTVAGKGWVTVRHAGELLETTYGGLDPRLVAAGQRVEAGQILGRLAPGAAHLDWGARMQGSYIDPLTLLGRWRIRLAPTIGARRATGVHPWVWSGEGLMGTAVGDLRRTVSRSFVHPGLGITSGRPRSPPPGVASAAMDTAAPSAREPWEPPPGSWATSRGSRASMLGNRGRDTAPEMAVRSAVHRRGLRYRVSVRPLPGLRRTADLVFTRARVAVFVDGCFWHGCPEHSTTVKRNGAYWNAKIAGNQQRDVDTDRRLRQQGWTPVRVWEHEDPEQAAERIMMAVRGAAPPEPAEPPPRPPAES